ncbi:MAG: hypothetical protein RSB61_00570 [Clostridia bacterium]
MSKEEKRAIKEQKRLVKERKKIRIRYFKPGGGCLHKPMTDEKYHSLVMKRKEKWHIYEKALAKLEIDPENAKIEPVEFHGYYFDEKALTRGNFSSKYQDTWLMFDKEQVFVYEFIFDMLSPSATESTFEYFYEDITTFATVDEIEEIETVVAVGKAPKEKKPKKGATEVKPAKKQETRIEKSLLMGSKFKIVAPGESFVCALTTTEETEANIKKMKLLLREKKSKRANVTQKSDCTFGDLAKLFSQPIKD